MTRRSRKGYYVNGEYVTPARAAAEELAADAADPGASSRTARKNASEDLQKTGEALLALRTDLFAALDLPERLRDAILEAKRLTNFGAKRRQLQFVGKLMRKLEPEQIDAIHIALEVDPYR
jgi:ribosome-associated protein